MLDPQRTLVAGAAAKLHLPQGDPSTPQWPGHLQVQLMVLHVLYPIRGTDCPDVSHIRWPGVLPLLSLLSSLSLLSFLPMSHCPCHPFYPQSLLSLCLHLLSTGLRHRFHGGFEAGSQVMEDTIIQGESLGGSGTEVSSCKASSPPHPTPTEPGMQAGQRLMTTHSQKQKGTLVPLLVFCPCLATPVLSL